MKKEEKIRAIALRKDGYSISEIADLTGVSKSSVSTWVRGVVLDRAARERIEYLKKKGRLKSHKTLRARKKQRKKDALRRAQQLLGSENKVLCAMLCWCEGAKDEDRSSLAFTNSDPLLVSTFLSLLRHHFEIDESKFRVCLHIHEYHNFDDQILFWSTVTNIPRSQFIKPFRKEHTGIRRRANYQGCVNIRYHDVQLARVLNLLAVEYMKQYGSIG